MAVAASSVAAAQLIFADLTGAWTFTVSLPDRTSQSLVDWKQKGDSLSGTVDVQDIGSSTITGIVKGDSVSFGFSIVIEGQSLPISGVGVLRDKDTLEGQLELPNGMGSFPYSGKRKQ